MDEGSHLARVPRGKIWFCSEFGKNVQQRLRRLLSMIALGAGLCLSTVNAATASAGSIIVQSTTSTQNAGFYEHVVPLFEQASGIKVKVVAVGTGQGCRMPVIVMVTC